MLIQWKDGQQTFQNAYFIFTSKNKPSDGFKEENAAEENFEPVGEFEEQPKEVLVEFEEDKYETKLLKYKRCYFYERF